MVTRRGFLSALCVLPFVGKFLPKLLPLTSENYQRITEMYFDTPDSSEYQRVEATARRVGDYYVIEYPEPAHKWRYTGGWVKYE